MSTLDLCRRFVLEMQSTFRDLDSEKAVRLASELSEQPPEIVYASVTAAVRSAGGWDEMDIHSDANSPASRWFQEHFVSSAVEALFAAKMLRN